jgi:SAM-dependent methyltransferase
VLTYLSGYDFAYGWVWNYGHLYLALVLAALIWILRARAPRWALALLGVVALWALVGFFIIQLAFRFNLPQVLPTEDFLKDGAHKPATARVLDIGCGSGRTTIMVALARPGVHVTGLDNFSADYITENGPERLKKNVRVAGIDENRVDVLAADMRKIPAPDASFDGAVSSFAVDHLDRQGMVTALHEISRVLKPDGEFLLSVIAADSWLKMVYGPLLMHHMRRVTPQFWENQLRDAGLTVTAQGRQPGARWFLSRKAGSAAMAAPSSP